VIRSFRDFRVYQASYSLALEVHKATRTFPDFEKYELGAQLRRAAVSIPANIAEGYGKRRSTADFKRFIGIALGSCNEVQVYLDMAHDLGYVDQALYQRWEQSYSKLGRQLHSLLDKWKSNI
jgi:four helix bundle protein